MKEYMVYDWYYDKITPEKTNKELLAKVNKIIAAAKECGAMNKKEKMDKYYYRFKEGENWSNMSEKRVAQEKKRVKKNRDNMPTDWVEVAEEELPTQAGFFFGSTEYDVYYLEDILSCKQQFEKLLADWKDNEVVYNWMSW